MTSSKNSAVVRTSQEGNNISVAVRIRPPLSREITPDGAFHSCVATCPADNNSDPTLYITTTDEPVLISEDGFPVGASSIFVKQFSFNHIFDQTVETSDVYRVCCKPAVQDALSGINATIFAYGQTGTGKTHTMLGTPHSPGITLLLAQDLFDAAKICEGTVDVEVSYVQLYMRQVTDLLADPSTAPKALDIRETSSGEVNIEGVSRHPVGSTSDLMELLQSGEKRRHVAHTELNSSSSRSHAVLTFHTTVWYGPEAEDGSQDATVSKVHLVDLAGSERVKDSNVGGAELKEACMINSSLFQLSSVVQALLRGDRHVPYKNDKLCWLLKDAIGGNSHTMMVATLSPAQGHAHESRCTLGFAASCSKVQNRARRNVRAGLPPRARPWLPPRARAPAMAPRPALPWSGAKAGGEQCPGGRLEVNTKLGKVSCLAYGDAAAPLAVCLHGYPSSAANAFGHWLCPALVHSGLYVVALDQPGCGSSTSPQHCNGGRCFKTRSEFNLEPGGPADVVCALIAALKGAKGRAHVLGYDWGAGIALSMGVEKRCRKHVESIVAFHPSYSEVVKDELTCIGAKTLVVWCEADQFHSWGKWKGNARKLERSLGPALYSQFVFKEPLWSKHGWDLHVEAIERKIVTFITSVDPIVEPQAVHARPEDADRTTTGAAVVRRDNIVLAGRAQALGRHVFEPADPSRDTVKALAHAIHSGTLPALYAAYTSKSGPLAQQAGALFRKLPCLTPEGLQDAGRLVELGLWARMPGGWHAMCRSPRYFPGRRVLLRAAVNPSPRDPDSFLALRANAKLSQPTARGRDDREMYTTYRAVIAGGEGQGSESAAGSGDVLVAVDREGGGQEMLRVSREEILRLNQSHAFPRTGCESELRLEDGIRCKYGSTLVNAKLCEIALALRPIAEQLDFDVPESCEQLQRRAVKIVRGCLDITTFQRDENGELCGVSEEGQAEGRKRDRSRYCGDDAGRFAVHGQGHCHTVSSVMAAFLHPWQAVLGIDLRYRGGCSVGEGPPVADAPETHQWLEFTTRPSCNSFTCDLYREDGLQERKGMLLDQPLEETYKRSLYPHGKLPVLSGSQVSTIPPCTWDFS